MSPIKSKEETDLFDFIQELMTLPKKFEFAYEINNGYCQVTD
jgi:hypothetical protein